MVDGARDNVIVLWSTTLMCGGIEVEKGERSGLQGVSEVMMKVSHPPRPRNGRVWMIALCSTTPRSCCLAARIKVFESGFRVVSASCNWTLSASVACQYAEYEPAENEGGRRYDIINLLTFHPAETEIISKIAYSMTSRRPNRWDGYSVD